MEWGRKLGLRYNAGKTQVMFCHRGERFDAQKLSAKLRINGLEIPFSKSVKYLGVTLTERLNWTPHIEDRVCKAKKTAMVARGIIGRNFVLNLNRALWIYKAVIRPKVTYGSVV